MKQILRIPPKWIPAEILNSYIQKNGGVKRFYEENIASHYIAYGAKYGVDWIAAFAQACHETGYFTFTGGVKPEHNNFAGLGATVSGKAGDVYKSISDGVRAHILHLCWYAGKVFPIEEYPDEVTGAPNRTQEVIEWGMTRDCVTFEDLAKAGYAADKSYWSRLQEHYKKLTDYAEAMMSLQPDKKDFIASWLEFNRADDGTPWLTALTADNVAIDDISDKKTDSLIKFLTKHQATARTWLVAETDKKIIPTVQKVELPYEPDEPDRPSPNEPDTAGQKRVWIPWAKDIGAIKTQGLYKNGYPTGAVVHHTAGRTLQGDHKALQNGPYPCLLIDVDGTVYQGFPLNRWGYHTGTYHHRDFVGIEVVRAGLLRKSGESYLTWFGTSVPKTEVRYVANAGGNQPLPISGYYHAFTEAQEKSLVKLILWLKNEAPDVFKLENVIGHDEACKAAGKYGAKNDAGGSLSMTMPQFREHLKLKYSEVNA